jgi:CHAD domain-containing protein
MGPSARHMRQSVTRSELLKKRVDAFTRMLKGVEEGDVRALHRARVASRRLRELLPMLSLGTATTRKLARRLRKVTARLGAVRELDVLLLSIDELHVSRRNRGVALGSVGVTVSKERDRARKRLQTRLPVAAMWRLARKLDRIVVDLQIGEAAGSRAETKSWRWAIDARVVRRATRLAAAMDEAGAVYLPERLHVVRVALKKVRYAVELANHVSGTRGDDLRILKRAQELLGRMHDLQMLIDRMRQEQALLAPPTLAAWRDLDALIVSLEDDCRRLHARYMRMRDALAAIAGRQDPRPQTGTGRVAAARRAG